MTTCDVTTLSTKETHIDFDGLVDSKGRKMGAWITTQVREAVENHESRGYVMEPGTWYAVNMCGSRNGSGYGVTGGTKMFRTEGERDKYISKRIKALRSKAA